MSAPVTTAGLDGLYTTDLTLGPEPAQNIVEARGSAPVLLPTIDPVSGFFSKPTTTMQAGTVFKIWGVKPTVEPDQLVMINSDGYPVKDTEIRFTVLPADYYYSTKSLFLDFYEKDTLQNESWMGFVKADPTGKIILTRGGVKFNPEYTYSVQLIVDRGRKIEVMSEKVTIPVAQIRVVTDETTPKEADEIKFGDGSNKQKKYKIELASRALMNTCVNLSGFIRVVDKNGQTITVPGTQGEYYSSNYPLDFHPTLDGKCHVTIDTAGGMDKFILSNLPKTVLKERDTVPSDTAVIYGGIGNTIQIEINGTRKDVPIEPVGVIVLGIDGLRQDVLYAPSEQQVDDPSGNYYVPSAELKGLCDVLGGKYSEGVLGIGSGCDETGMEKRHIKLRNVTAIFPSITVASWASIFTGKMPSETGILGNEFFARDLMNKNISWNGNTANVKVNVPERYNNPAGVISFSSGAFKGYDTFGVFDLDDTDFFIPIQGYWTPSVNPSRTPQNDRQILKPDTVYEMIVGRPSIEGMPDQPGITGVKDYFAAKGGDSVVAANSHYARGAYWLTWALTWSWYGDSETLDKAAWTRLDDYMKGRYLTPSASSTPSNYPRNNIPFSALTVLYLPGLDHEAHILGMDEYRNYFIDDTDRYVKYIVDWLKKYDEFDNKIFVIVADHGMTAMPTDLKYKDISWLGGSIEVLKDAEMSCKFKLEFDDADTPGTSAQNAERENNNLHIWELGEALRSLQEKKPELQYNVLAPEKIAELFIDTPAGAKKNLDPQSNQAEYANVVATFNGPMAHIYFRGQSGWQYPPNPEELKKIAEVLRVLYQVDNLSEAQNALGIDMVGYLNLLENTIDRMKQSVDKILIRIGGEYLQFNGYSVNGYAINSLSFTSEYIKAPERVTGLNDPNRSGDIVLIMKDSTAGPDLNRYTTGVACKSWHGSLSASDSYVPFIVAYPAGNKHEITPLIDSTQGCNVASGCDGNWRVTDLIKTIIQKQHGSL